MAFVESFIRGGEDFFAGAANTIGSYIPRLDSRFLFPGALILALFLIPFIILYLIRPKPTEKTVSSLMFLIKDTGKSFIRSFFQTFVRDPLFILQLFILIFLILAAAHPFLNLSEMSVDKPTVIILDVSGSMQAQDRFSEAKKMARDSLASENTLILAKNLPETASIGLSRHKTATLIDALRPSDTETNLYDAILLAPTYLKGPGRIVIISDFAVDASFLNAKNFLESQGHKVYLKKAGSEASNIGIVDIDVKEKKSSVVIKNYNAKEEVVRVKVNGELIDTKTIPAESSDLSSFTTPSGTSTVELDVKDDYAPDNKAYISAPENHTVSVLIISNDDNIRLFDFVLALDAISSNSTTQVTYEFAAPPKVPAIDQDIVIFKNVKKELLLPGTIEDTIKQVKRGGAAIVMIQDDLFSIKFGDLLPYTFKSKETQGLIEKTDQGLSLTENVDFGTVGTYFVLAPDPAVIPIANVGDSPIIGFKNLNHGMVMYYGIFDESADFPKEPYYPIFWKRTVDYLSGKPDIASLNYKTGRILALPAAEDVKTPAGTVSTSSLSLDYAGFYDIGKQKVAANLVSAEESDLNRQRDTGMAVSDEAFLEKPNPEPYELAAILLTAALVLLVLELFFLKFRGDL